jgi:hypothetical protein
MACANGPIAATMGFEYSQNWTTIYKILVRPMLNRFFLRGVPSDGTKQAAELAVCFINH